MNTLKTKTTIEQLEQLWNRVPNLSLGHLISLAVADAENLYQMPDHELLSKVRSFVAAMEHQQNNIK